MEDLINAAALALHGLAAAIWVGGMFFAYMILRPASGGITAPPERLQLWARVFERFFRWVTAAIIILPATGYWIVFDYFGGFHQAAIHIHWMHGTAWLMIGFYIYMRFRPYRHFKQAISDERWEQAAHAMDGIRRLVHVNLMLGLFTVLIGASGRLWAWLP